ncbi:hypothetical protein IJ843_02965 [bacterium]|nr:hypothetical protein [bacterium]
MEKRLFKIFIGMIAFVVFVAIGYPKVVVHNENVNKAQKQKGLISRNGSGHYTRNSQAKINKKDSKSSYSGVIYIGESTDGLLD